MGVDQVDTAAENALLRRRLAALTDALPVLISFVDATERYQYVNSAYELWFDKPAECFVGRHLADVLGASAYELIAPYVRRALDGEPVTFEACIPYETGPRDVRVRYVPMHDACGQVEGIAVMVDDISETKRAQEERKRTEHFREMFLGMLGHDLRNPLSAIATAANLSLRRGLPEQQARTIGRIVSSAERMARMIDQVLDATRVRLGGGLHLEPRMVEVGELVHRIVDECEAAHPGRHVDLRHAAPVLVRCDPIRIGQVLSNLICNALQHGDEQLPPRVSMRVADARVCIDIQNHGAAIPPEVVPALFDPFARGRAARTGKSRGLGLGLYITRQIMLAHGGSVEVESTEAGRTTFTVCLPAPPAPSSA